MRDDGKDDRRLYFCDWWMDSRFSCGVKLYNMGVNSLDYDA